MALTGVKGLQRWCQIQVEGYPGVEVTNMTKSWRNGLAFCALIHRYRPDLIDFHSLKATNILENNQLAFDVADRELGVAPLLDAEDMVALEVPDRLSICTYVSQFYNVFNGLNPMGGLGGVRQPEGAAARPAVEPSAKKKPAGGDTGGASATSAKSGSKFPLGRTSGQAVKSTSGTKDAPVSSPSRGRSQVTPSTATSGPPVKRPTTASSASPATAKSTSAAKTTVSSRSTSGSQKQGPSRPSPPASASKATSPPPRSRVTSPPAGSRSSASPPSSTTSPPRGRSSSGQGKATSNVNDDLSKRSGAAAHLRNVIPSAAPTGSPKGGRSTATDAQTTAPAVSGASSSSAAESSAATPKTDADEPEAQPRHSQATSPPPSQPVAAPRASRANIEAPVLPQSSIRSKPLASTSSQPTATVPVKRDRSPIKPAGKTGTLGNAACHLCNLPVSLVERTTIEGIIMHRQCFRCSECNCQLRDQGYHIFNNQFFCERDYRMEVRGSKVPTLRRKCSTDVLSPLQVASPAKPSSPPTTQPSKTKATDSKLSSSKTSGAKLSESKPHAKASDSEAESKSSVAETETKASDSKVPDSKPSEDKPSETPPSAGLSATPASASSADDLSDKVRPGEDLYTAVVRDTPKEVTVTPRTGGSVVEKAPAIPRRTTQSQIFDVPPAASPAQGSQRAGSEGRAKSSAAELGKRKKAPALPPPPSMSSREKPSAPSSSENKGKRKAPPLPSQGPSVKPSVSGTAVARPLSPSHGKGVAPAAPRPLPPKEQRKKRRAPIIPQGVRKWVAGGRVIDEERLTLEDVEQRLAALDKELQDMEAEGIKLENKLRSATGDAEERLMEKWFGLIERKNDLASRETELVYHQKDLGLVRQREDLEKEIRTRMEKDPEEKTDEERAEENALIEELVEIVDERNHLLNMLDVERLQEQEEAGSTAAAAPSSSKSSAPNKAVDAKKSKKPLKDKKEKKDKKGGSKENGFRAYI